MLDDPTADPDKAFVLFISFNSVQTNGMCVYCRILQLTWRTSKVLSYAIANLDDVKELHSPLKVIQPLPCRITVPGQTSIIASNRVWILQVPSNACAGWTRDVPPVSEKGLEGNALKL